MATFDVLLPVKDGIAFLAESIESIIGQTYQDWRLIVLDHGSTDGSVELSNHYAERDARVIVRAFPNAVGLSGLLNCGLDLCDCKYVLRQDADDVSMPDRMMVLSKTFDENPSVVLLGSLGDVIDARGEKIGSIDMPTGPNGVAATILFRSPLCHPSVAMRFGALQSLGRVNGTKVRYGLDFLGAIPSARRMTVPGLAEDYFLFGQLALIAPCQNIPNKLIKYRWHGANVSTTKYLAQIQMALEISRYLAESLSILKNVPHFDPAPFCNHGESLFNIHGKTDFSAEFAVLAQVLRDTISASEELERELAFRKVISNRSILPMGLRFATFMRQHKTRPAESNTIRSWMLRSVKKQPVLKLEPSGVLS
ncbi:MAG: glycosyltransferase [Pseudomonadota bacterium]